MRCNLIIGGVMLAVFSLPVFTSSHATTVDPYETYGEIAPGNFVTGISKMKGHQGGQVPTIVVESSGKDMKYDRVVPNQTFRSRFDYEMDCRGLERVRNITIGVTSGPTKYTSYQHPGQFAYFNKVITPDSKKKGKRNGSTTLSGPLTKKMEQNAIRVCNKFLENAPEALHKGFTVNWIQLNSNYVPFKHYMFGRCSMAPTHGAHLIQGVKINYQCKARPKRASFLALKSVSLDIDNANYVGQCPSQRKFTAKVATNGIAGDLSYRFRNHKGKTTPWTKLTIAQGKKTKTIIHYEALMKSTPGEMPLGGVLAPAGKGFASATNLQSKQNPFVEIEVRTPHAVKKANRTYRYKCIERAKTKPKGVIMTFNPKPQAAIDLTADAPFHIGGQQGLWGGVINLGAADGSVAGARGCKFRFRYDLLNQGSGDAGQFASRLRDGGSQVHLQNLPGLTAQQGKPVAGTIALKPGSHLINLSVDDSKKVAESNEGNNRFRITVNVAESCGGKAQDASASRPGASRTGGRKLR